MPRGSQRLPPGPPEGFFLVLGPAQTVWSFSIVLLANGLIFALEGSGGLWGPRSLVFRRFFAFRPVRPPLQANPQRFAPEATWGLALGLWSLWPTPAPEAAEQTGAEGHPSRPARWVGNPKPVKALVWVVKGWGLTRTPARAARVVGPRSTLWRGPTPARAFTGRHPKP